MLSAPEESGNRSRQQVVNRAEGSPRAVALSFDDGPSRWTLAIADAIEAEGRRATFFLRGEAVEERPEVAAELARRGHELGNHLWSHTAAEELDDEAVRAELERTAEAVERATGVDPVLVRPPYLSDPERVARLARGAGGERVVGAGVVPEDWRLESGDEIARAVLVAVRPGDIVCLHDGIPSGSSGTSSREPTVGAVRQLVPELARRGLRQVTVSELLS